MKYDIENLLYGKNVTSLKILKDKVTSYLSNQDNYNVWFPDIFESEYNLQDEPVHVVLLGDFFRKFFESGNWIIDKILFHTMCTSSKNVLTKLLKIPADKICVINRYELYPPQEAKVPDPSKEINLICAGRISAQKNIEALLLVYYYLEKNSSLNLRLHLFGEFDNEFNEDKGPKLDFNYEKRITSLLKEIDFKNPPIFHGKVSHNSWMNHNLSQEVFISFSTFFNEDFGVSVAQAQQKGMPCILSDWGAHKDITKGIRTHINSTLIPLPFETLSTLKIKSKIIANLISETIIKERWKTRDTSEINSMTSSNLISLKEIDLLRRQFCYKYPNLMTILNSEPLSVFAATKKGSDIINQYHLQFGSSLIDANIIIFNNAHIERHTCDFIKLVSSFDQENLFLCPINLVFKQSLTKKLLRSNKITLFLEPKLKKKLTTFLGFN